MAKSRFRPAISLSLPRWMFWDRSHVTMLCAVLGILVSEPDCLFIIPGLCRAHGWGGQLWSRLSPGFRGQSLCREGAHRPRTCKPTQTDTEASHISRDLSLAFNDQFLTLW